MSGLGTTRLGRRKRPQGESGPAAVLIYSMLQESVAESVANHSLTIPLSRGGAWHSCVYQNIINVLHSVFGGTHHQARSPGGRSPGRCCWIHRGGDCLSTSHLTPPLPLSTPFYLFLPQIYF